MATVREPLVFSEHFDIDPEWIREAGILDPVLNVDTKLFIDPLLLRACRHEEISNRATKRLRGHFTKIYKLLAASKRKGDVAWRQAERLFDFSEIPATCLGYGAGSIGGSGMGPMLVGRALETAQQIVAMGVDDPDLFLLLPLLEEGVGPDRISDMVTNIVLTDLCALTARLAKEWEIPTEIFTRSGVDYALPRNPTAEPPLPVVLVPLDILRDLPVASDWLEVRDAASKNQALRNRVNEQIGGIWRAQTAKEKRERRERVLNSPEALKLLLEILHESGLEPYDEELDRAGELRWKELLGWVAERFPREIAHPTEKTSDAAAEIVTEIIRQFEFLVEERGLWKLLWRNGTPHREHVAQRVFFAVAYSYCKANNLDVSPEQDTGTGMIDFKFSHGFDCRILVEVKLSRNPKLLAGYTRQLEAYKASEETDYAYYLVIVVGNLGRKDEELNDLRNESLRRSGRASQLAFVEGNKQPPASKR